MEGHLPGRSYRLLHPKSTTYSHSYNRQMVQGTGTGLTQGALDRSYTWGDIKTVSSEYIGAAFSDHMLHLVRLECPEATEAAEDHFKPYFKISPETAKDAEFQDRVQQQAAKQISRERAKEKRATLTFLMLVQSHLSKKTSKGNLSLLPKLKSIQLRINNWFDEQAEKVRLHSRLKDIQESEKVRIYHHEQLYRTNNKSSITKLKTPLGIISGHKECADFLNKDVSALLETEAELVEAAQGQLLDEVEEGKRQ